MGRKRLGRKRLGRKRLTRKRLTRKKLTRKRLTRKKLTRKNKMSGGRPVLELNQSIELEPDREYDPVSALAHSQQALQDMDRETNSDEIKYRLSELKPYGVDGMPLRTDGSNGLNSQRVKKGLKPIPGHR